MLTADYPALLQLLQWTAASKTEVATIVYMLNKALEGYIQVIRQKIDSLEPYERSATSHNAEEQVHISPVSSSIDQSASAVDAGDLMGTAEDAELIAGDVASTAEDATPVSVAATALAVSVVPTVPEHPSMPLLLDMFNIHKTCSKRMGQSQRQVYEQLFIKLFQKSELFSETATATPTGVSSGSTHGAPAALSEADELPLLTTSWRVEGSRMDTTSTSTPISTVLKACTSRWSSQAGRGKVQGDKVDGRRKKRRKTDSNTIAQEVGSSDAVIGGEAAIAICTTEHTTVPPAVMTIDDDITVTMDHDQHLQHQNEVETDEESKEEFV